MNTSNEHHKKVNNIQKSDFKIYNLNPIEPSLHIKHELTVMYLTYHVAAVFCSLRRISN